MPYAEMGDVQASLPQFQLSAVSKPTLASAERMLVDVDARWRAALVTYGYDLAAIDADPYAPLVLKEHVITCTLAKILMARAGAIGGDASFQSADKYKEQCLRAMEALAKGELDLGLVPNEPLASGPLYDFSSFPPRTSMDDLW